MAELFRRLKSNSTNIKLDISPKINRLHFLFPPERAEQSSELSQTGAYRSVTKKKSFLISNFRRVLNVVCFLLGDSPAPEIYMPTFRNTHLPAYEDGTDRVFRNVGI